MSWCAILRRVQDFEVDDGRLSDGTELYLVRATQASGVGVLFLHWFDEAPSANRTQFLEEAKALSRFGVSSVLPQLRFPWATPPTDIESDLAEIAEEANRVREAYDLLRIGGVDRIGLVGHDFGAMHGLLLLGEVPLDCAVLIAPTPRWADWFLPFWPIDTDRYDYMRRLHDVDPITAISKADTPLLFQFGDADFYIAAMTARELYAAAPDPKQVINYNTGHEMDDETSRADRLDFLATNLDFDPTGNAI